VGRATKRLWLAAALAGLALTALPATARADSGRAQPLQASDVVGTYTTKFVEVSNNCKGTGLTIGTTTTTIEVVSGRSIQVSIPMMPAMRGAVRKGGKFRAKAKKGKTAIEGLDGRFSAGGRVDAQAIQFVFIAEYFRGKEPLCTQSWNVSGTKKK